MIRRIWLPALALVVVATGTACSNDDGAPLELGPGVNNSAANTTAAPAPAGEPSASTLATDATGSTTHGPVTQASLIEPGVTSNTVGGPLVACKVEVSGEVTATFNSYDDRAAFSSDYYLSAEEIAAAAIPRGVTTLPGGTMPTFSAPPRPAGTAPLAGWFLLNCQGGDISISFFSNPMSTTDDVPFDDGKYTITPASATSDDPTHFLASASFFADPTMQYVVDEGARIKLDRFDERGAAGSFVVPMKDVASDGGPSTKKILLKGTFEVACRTGANCHP